MKKILNILIMLILIVSFSACTQETQVAEPTNDVMEEQNTQKVADSDSDSGSKVLMKLSELNSGDIKTFNLGGVEGVIVNIDGEISAFVNSCTHKQLKFDDNSLVDNKIVCPFHDASFNTTNGDYLGTNGDDYGLSGLENIKVSVVGEDIILG